MKRSLLLCLAAAIMVTSCNADQKADDSTPPDPVVLESEKTKDDSTATEEKQQEPEMITTESGLRYQDLVVGEGVEATEKMRVDCHYTLWLADSTGLEKGERLQSSKDGGNSFQCTIGTGLITGWSEGMVGMKEGGTRLLYVPWSLGYGAGGRPPMIPGKSNLIFEIEFLKKVGN